MKRFPASVSRQLIAVINLAAHTQETEGLSEVSADFWHEVRREVRKRHQPGWFIFPQCAASGDISPHLMFHKRAEQCLVGPEGGDVLVDEVLKTIRSLFQ